MINNYRPISILSILPIISKAAEKVVAEQLMDHLDTSGFSLHPMQFGFRANHSNELANCYSLGNIQLKLDKEGVVGAVFLVGIHNISLSISETYDIS
jgi:hypothetical protein